MRQALSTWSKAEYAASMAKTIRQRILELRAADASLPPEPPGCEDPWRDFTACAQWVEAASAGDTRRVADELVKVTLDLENVEAGIPECWRYDAKRGAVDAEQLREERERLWERAESLASQLKEQVPADVSDVLHRFFGGKHHRDYSEILRVIAKAVRAGGGVPTIYFDTSISRTVEPKPAISVADIGVVLGAAGITPVPGRLSPRPTEQGAANPTLPQSAAIIPAAWQHSPDAETIAEVRRTVWDWDGKNRTIIYELLRQWGRSPSQIARMTWFDVRMAFAAGFISLSGVSRTNHSGVGGIVTTTGAGGKPRADLPGYMGLDALVKYFDIPEPKREAFRKRLDRFRAEHAQDSSIYIEHDARARNEARYLYNPARVADLIGDMK
jgi:hypothetical protein